LVESIRILLGTTNPDKAKEIQAIFGQQYKLLTAKDHPFSEVQEDGQTLEDNARKKAQTISKETGLPVLAEDTGLEVDALDGAPGVYSGRYAGENATYQDNILKLLDALKGKTKRRAHFRCVCVLHFPDGQELLTGGTLTGAITAAARGRDGFGYDPVFLPDGFSKTLAELPTALKNQISHRAKGIRAMKAKLQAHLEAAG